MLARFAGAVPRPQAEAAEKLLRAEGLAAEIVDEDEGLWDAQRAAQRRRRARGARVRRCRRTSRRARRRRRRLAWSGRAGARPVVAAFEEPSAEAVERLRRDSRSRARPPGRIERRPAGRVDPGARELMRRVKERFDPAGSVAM